LGWQPGAARSREFRLKLPLPAHASASLGAFPHTHFQLYNDPKITLWV
jgi:hypothetical protein